VPAQANDRPVQINVFSPTQVGVEADADLEQCAHATVEHNAALSRRNDPGGQLEDRTLTRAIIADDAHRFARMHSCRKITQDPEL